MIQLQNNLFVRQEFCRTLAPLSPIRESGRRLQELADVAVCLDEPGVYSPAASPTTPFPKDYSSRETRPAASENRGCGVPSIQTLFAIADRDRRPPQEGAYHHPVTQTSNSNSSNNTTNNNNNDFRRPSFGSEYSWQGSAGSAPELSPHLSTAHTSPTVTPVTPGFPVDWHSILPILPQSSLKIDVRLAGELQRSAEEQHRRRLELARPRRPSARQEPYAPAARNRRNGSSNSSSISSNISSNSSSSGSSMKQHQQPPRQQPQPQTQPCLGVTGTGIPISTQEDGSRDRKPHFNQPYTRSVKLFILYYKDDCKFGWPAINARRVELLPVLLGGSYKREVEENRKVAGINGFYYRLNAMMPALTPDGSGLLFMERDGRFWEFTESSKVRTATESKAAAAAAAAASSSCPSPSPSSTTPARTDARPRGMVDRYPEEVVHYWDEYVRHFVPPEKHAEVYARAKRYCDIRAEQRREKGVPQWTPDNEAERVVHKNPPDGKSKASKKGNAPEERVLREMMSACVLNPTQ